MITEQEIRNLDAAIEMPVVNLEERIPPGERIFFSENQPPIGDEGDMWNKVVGWEKSYVAPQTNELIQISLAAAMAQGDE